MKYGELWDLFFQKRKEEGLVLIEILGVKYSIETTGLFDHTRDLAEMLLRPCRPPFHMIHLVISFEQLHAILTTDGVVKFVSGNNHV